MMSVRDWIRALYAGVRHDLRERKMPPLAKGESRTIPAFDPTLPKGSASYGSGTSPKSQKD